MRGRTGFGRVATRTVTPLAAALLVVAGPGTLALGAAGASVPNRSVTRDASVTVVVDDVSPNSPVLSKASSPRPIDFTLTLTNTTDNAISGIRVSGERGNPVTSEAELGKLSLAPSAASSEGVGIKATRAVTASLPAGGSTAVTFSTTTSMANGPGICECADAVYPILLTATTGASSSPVTVGTGGTYVPIVVDDTAPRTGATWLWPLIDRPHRLTDTAEFTDDTLTGEVSAGGRLDRALQVVEQVAPTVPMALVVDPELIDELAVMASGAYRVRSTDGASAAGTGTQAASAWLSRLHSVLTGANDVQVFLTAFADPDIQSLVSHGGNWRSRMPSSMSARVMHALEGRTVGTDLTWPAGERISREVLNSLAVRGTRQVVVSSTGLTQTQSADAATPGVVRLRGGSTPVTGLVASPSITQLVSDGVTTGSDGGRVLPRLVSELAVRALEQPDADGDDTATGRVLLLPPRYVDPDVDAASRIIETTSRSTYTTPVAAAGLVAGSDATTVRLSRSVPRADGLPSLVLDAVDAYADSDSMITSLLSPSPSDRATNRVGQGSAAQLLAGLPATLQRAESSAWRSRGGLSPDVGLTYAKFLSGQLDSLRNGVHIVPPSSGSYTLASGNSKLPVTVSNELSYPATVDVRLDTVGGLPGLSTRAIESRTIPARTTVIVHVPASINRTARIKVRAYLTAPNGMSVGSPIVLSVRSTAFGRLGIIIMSVAGALLLLALARRWYRSARARSGGRATSPPVGTR